MAKKKPACLSFFGLCVVLVLAWGAPPGVYAQVLYGSITGNVSDASGARVPGAEAKITNPDTNYTQSSVSDDSGIYTLKNIPDGTYTLTVTMPGFKEFQAKGVLVKVGTVTRQDVSLQVGERSDVVTVNSAATILQTDTADVHVQLETKEITNLPIGAYRNYQSLINLVPGATPAEFQNAVTDTPQRALTTNVNGTARNSNNTRIDGAQSINVWLPHHSGYVPPAETIEVVNVATDNFDAETGFAGGAATTVITKSGTNEFHGSAFALHENRVTNARDFFFYGDKTPHSLRNIDGGTVGGRIIKDKLFFFVGFEATMERLGQSSLETLPTAAQIAGDFSAFAAPIYDPQTGNADGTGRTPFPNNKIPSDRISTAAAKLAALIPATNLPGAVANYQATGVQDLNRYNTDTKFDWYRSQSHHIWGKFSYMDATVSKAPMFGAAGGGSFGNGDGQGITHVKVWGIGHSWTLTPKFLIDGNWGLNAMNQQVITSDLGLGNFGQSVLGIPGTNDTSSRACPSDPIDRCGGIPAFFIAGFSGLGQVDGWSPLFREERSYSFSHNFSYTKSKHEMRWGYDLVKLDLTHWQPELGSGPRGQFDFGQEMTLPQGAAGTDQNAFASFLLGLPNHVGKGLQWDLMTTREWQHALYFRDRWQATRNLTLTLGLRYEVYPLVTREDRPMEQLDFNTFNVNLNNNISIGKKNFAPRVGFAYRMGDKNVLRAGFGITYDPLPFGRPLRGFFPLTVAADFNAPDPYVPFRNLAQGIPLFTGPDESTGVVPLPGNVQMRSMPPDMIHRGYIESWNLVWERKLPKDFVVSAGYVGTETVHQLADFEMNWAPPGTGTAGGQLYNKLDFQGDNRTASTLYWDGWLSSNYHSLQVAVNRRFTGGLFVKGAYTYSRAINMADDDGWTGVSWNDPALISRNRAQAGFNRPQVLQLAMVYELPFGKQGNSFAHHLIRGWQVNGIFSANQTRPFTVGGSGLNAVANSQTADQIKADVQNLGGIGPGDPYYDPTAFLSVNSALNPNSRAAVNGVCQHLDANGNVTSTSAANDCYGNSGRNILRGPSWVNLDFSVFRQFKVTEQSNVEFRWEAFNLTNTAHFATPNGDATSGGFMTITSTNGNAPNRVMRFSFHFRF
jgi:hypothetical protein